MSATALLASLRASPAAKIGASIAIATGLYGVSFGALSVASGLSFWQTMVLSLLLFSGGSQFAFIGVVAAGGTGVAAMSASALLGIRNGVYGMQLNALMRPTGWRRFAAAHVTIDESTATATGQSEPREQKIGFWVAGLGIFVLWNIMTAVGAVLGDALGDPKQWGLDGAAVAAFLGLLWPRIKAFQPAAIAVVCAVVTLLAVPFVPPGVPILVAALVAGLIGWFRSGGTPDHAPGHVGDGMEPDIDPYPHAGKHDAGVAGPGAPGPATPGTGQEREEP
ncbi:putative branched-subunit amino acid permease [Arthrobacter stackebrandtii]|uniref:Branched-subunit amino acid permease n=1 Tax=Arthrobacter stackebrandtii TaxID=272161 RepID=A0ABS4YVT8_9MICC|nr:putative branched-subunit amino acid permease [Arthrobacter stackebrandtii]PYH01281.1 branched-chain amino acid ABC transporter permease [Arthrobacter stackebrandtii]